MRRAEILAIGSELTSGQRADTNGPWLSRELAEQGIATVRRTVVADDLAEIVEALHHDGVRRADLIIVTGGLGPTQDDLTRQAIAEAAGVALVIDEISLAAIEDRYRRLGRPMPEANRLQAQFPEGAEVIPNPRGTAPGIWLELSNAEEPARHGCIIVALPGVPAEMKPLFREAVAPRLPVGDQVIRHDLLNVFGLGESAVEERLGDLTARGRSPEVGITAHEATISLRITTRGTSQHDCARLAEPAKTTIRERLGALVYGEGEERLQDVVVALLRQHGETLAVVETALSGGRLTEWLANTPGGEAVLRGGLTAISLDIGLESPEIVQAGHEDDGNPARMLAEAYRDSFQASWGLSIVGIPGEADNLVRGTIAVVGPDCVATVAYHCHGEADLDRSRSAKTALDLLRRRLLRSQRDRTT